MTEGYAAYRKAKQAQEAQASSVCKVCAAALPVGSRRGRLYCSDTCKNQAFEANRQPRPKRERADYHKYYQRKRRATNAQNTKEA